MAMVSRRLAAIIQIHTEIHLHGARPLISMLLCPTCPLADRKFHVSCSRRSAQISTISKEKILGSARISDGIARVYSLRNIPVMEMVEFSTLLKGMALNLEPDSVGSVMFCNYQLIEQGDMVKRLKIFAKLAQNEKTDIVFGKQTIGDGCTQPDHITTGWFPIPVNIQWIITKKYSTDKKDREDQENPKNPDEFVPKSLLLEILEKNGQQAAQQAQQAAQQAALQAELIGELRTKLNERNMVMKKIGVISFLQCRLELYESILSNFDQNASLRNRNSDPPDLDTLSINLTDQTVKESYYLHYNRWWNIIHHSRDSRITAIRSHAIELFIDYNNFCRYMAILFVHLSNMLHNIPPDIVNWENEDDVVHSLEEWNIDDTMELNACRMLYRIPRTRP